MRAFRVEPAEGGTVYLTMDDPVRRVNVLDEAALSDLNIALVELERLQPAGVILRSGKPGSFIAGADVQAIAAITDRTRVLELVRLAHDAFGRLAALPCPTVAAIDGVCLGGGTELALACDSRIASEEPRTQIGLPEVLLGIFPGFGGSTRLPRLVGLPGALDLILTGRALDGRRAEKLGLIARAVPAAWLLEHAQRRVAELAKRRPRRRRDAWRARGLGPWLLERTSLGRGIVLRAARKRVLERTGGHYPAPLAALGVIEKSMGKPLETGLRLEADAVSELVVSPVCKNLVRLFLLSERAKKDAVADPALAPAPVRAMALVGAGVMGGGIAELASRAGLEVRLRDLNGEAITRALVTARGLIAGRDRKRTGRGAAAARAPGAAGSADAQMARILPTLDLTGFGRCEFAMEAVVEDLDVKRRVFGELEVRIRPDTLLATNTSSLSVEALASGLQRPERFCGFHFFNPVHRMPLVEVVRGPRTSDAALVTAVALARRLGKTPVVVRDAPGFVVNRVLMPYLREAMTLLEEGFSVTGIDAAMRDFGMPMGPFEVLDEVGLDVAQKVAGVLSRAFPDRMESSAALDTLVGAGRLGRKSGRGFYRHRDGKRLPDPRLLDVLKLKRGRLPHQPDALTERLTLAMINEAARCVEEGVAADAGWVDLALVFGAGFPPWRGGPLRYADHLGLARVESRLRALRAERGERYAPAALLARLAAAGGSLTTPEATAGA
jgi:3-hydroxyacyl-CoA dehydrogenase / enoyl-CoA hydratase / 3-hydroxybutyryl-CoA epimerase